jgi:hypothetical protein
MDLIPATYPVFKEKKKKSDCSQRTWKNVKKCWRYTNYYNSNTLRALRISHTTHIAQQVPTGYPITNARADLPTMIFTLYIPARRASWSYDTNIKLFKIASGHLVCSMGIYDYSTCKNLLIWKYGQALCPYFQIIWFFCCDLHLERMSKYVCIY